jgi:hypothetical protein
MAFSTLRSFGTIALPLVVLAGCVIKEGNPNAAAPGAPATAAPPPATETPVATATPTVAVATPTGTVAPTTGTATTGMINPGVAKQMPEMIKGNAFGQPKPFTGSVQGWVYAIPSTTTVLPDFSTLTSFATLYSQSWNIPARDFKEGFPGVPGDRTEWFAIHWDGTIYAAKGGSYNFRMISDDGARMFIDNVLIVNDDGTHPPKEAKGGTTLNAGPHHVVIDYFQGPKWQIALQIFVSGTNMPEKPLTSSF